MTTALDSQRFREARCFPRPHLSHSQLNRYLHCPEQYRLYYVENLRLRVPSANLAFGSAIHRAMEGLFRSGLDAASVFEREWATAQDLELSYSRNSTWDSLQHIGRTLLERFQDRHAARISDVVGVEHRFEVGLTGLPQPLVGYVDLVARFEGAPSVIDFKTASPAYRPHEAVLSDQLSLYGLAEPEAEQGVLCILVKTKAPRILWQTAQKDPERQVAYVRKACIAAAGISQRHFYRRPGTWCNWCDYLPCCTGDRAQAEATLIRIEPPDEDASSRAS